MHSSNDNIDIDTRRWTLSRSHTEKKTHIFKLFSLVFIYICLLSFRIYWTVRFTRFYRSVWFSIFHDVSKEKQEISHKEQKINRENFIENNNTNKYKNKKTMWQCIRIEMNIEHWARIIKITFHTRENSITRSFSFIIIIIIVTTTSDFGIGIFNHRVVAFFFSLSLLNKRKKNLAMIIITVSLFSHFAILNENET